MSDFETEKSQRTLKTTLQGPNVLLPNSGTREGREPVLFFQGGFRWSAKKPQRSPPSPHTNQVITPKSRCSPHHPRNQDNDPLVRGVP